MPILTMKIPGRILAKILISAVKIREIYLEKSVNTLYTTIVNALAQEQPSALMVLDLELVSFFPMRLSSRALIT